MSGWTLDNGYDSALGEVRWERLGDPAADPVVLLTFRWTRWGSSPN